MLSKLVICAAGSVLVAGCANGWPRVHHLHQTANTDCMPTGSKIARATDCAISQPTSSASQGDLDRQNQQGLGTVQVPALQNTIPR